MIVFLSILSADTPTQKQLIKSLLRWWWWWLYFWAYLVLTHWGWGWPTREKTCQEFTGSVMATQRTLRETRTSRSVSHPWHIVNLVDLVSNCGPFGAFFSLFIFPLPKITKIQKKIQNLKIQIRGIHLRWGDGWSWHLIWDLCVCSCFVWVWASKVFVSDFGFNDL